VTVELPLELPPELPPLEYVGAADTGATGAGDEPPPLGAGVTTLCIVEGLLV